MNPPLRHPLLLTIETALDGLTDLVTVEPGNGKEEVDAAYDALATLDNTLSAPSKSPLNARVIPTLYADLPISFEERVDGRMAYHEGEEGSITIARVWMNEAEPAFKQTDLYRDLVALFAAFPSHEEAVLQPR